MYGIENLARVDVLCLDKTGTLTSGKMRVAEVIALGGTSEETLAQMMGDWNSAFSGEDTPESVLRRADEAMYQAKESGGNTVRHFDPEAGERRPCEHSRALAETLDPE